MASTSTAAVEAEQTSTRLRSAHHRGPRVILLACGSFNPPTFMHLRMFELARDYLHRRTNYRVIEGVISVVNDAYRKKDLVTVQHRLAMVRLAIENSKWIRLDEWEAKQTQWCPTINVLRHIRNVVSQRISREQAYQKSISIDDGGSLDIGSMQFRKLKVDVPTAQNSTESSGVGSTVSDHLASSVTVVPKAASVEFPVTTPSSSEGEEALRVMLLCGSDLLQSFEVPNLWTHADIEEIVRDFGIVVVTRTGYDSRKIVYESDILSRYEGNVHFVTEWIASDISSTKIRRALKRSESVRYLVPDKVLDYVYRNNLYGCSRGLLDILTSPSLFLDASPETTTSAGIDFTDAHCSYHPQYKRMQKKSITEESDYDNLAPCPCPLVTSASAPNATAVHLTRSTRPTTSTIFTRAISTDRVHAMALSSVDKSLSLDTTSSEPTVIGKPTKFPTGLETMSQETDSPSNDASRPTARSMATKSALKSPPMSTNGRQRAVSYHSDLNRSTDSKILPSSQTMDMGETSKSTEYEERPIPSKIPFGSVSIHQRSNSNEIQDTHRNGAGVRRVDSGHTTVNVSKNGQVVSVSETEEVTWRYDPELTKSLPNLRFQRQTPPRHVRIMDKGVCFTHGEREEGVEIDQTVAGLANNLTVKVKQLKLTISPETTV